MSFQFDDLFNKDNIFAEKVFLKNFGSTKCDSIDINGYENPTHIYDLTTELNNNLSQYDTIIDSGSIEHTKNPYKTLENYSKLCKINGRIIINTPLNNLSGHGFFQISIDFFLSFFSKENGYTDLECYVVNWSELSRFYPIYIYKIDLEDIRKGLVMRSAKPLHVFFKAKKTSEVKINMTGQESYKSIYENQASLNSNIVDKYNKEYLKSTIIILNFLKLSFLFFKSFINTQYRIGDITTNEKSHIKKIKIKDLIRTKD